MHFSLDSDFHSVADEEPDELLYTSHALHVQNGIQPIMAKVVQTEQPAQTASQPEDTKEYDFCSYPGVMEFD